MKAFFDLRRPATRAFRWALFAFAFVLMALLMYWSPFMSDDFEFSSFDFASLAEAADYCLHYGNGRLLGNLGNIVLLENTLLRVVVKAAAAAGILVLLPKALKLESRMSWLLSFLLFLGVAPSMFAQIYTWTSGFQNYVPPVLILILCYLLWDAPKNARRPVEILKGAALFLLAFMGQLYMELATILSVILGLAATVYAAKKDRKKLLFSLLYLAGAALGALVMLLIPRLFEITYEFSVVYRRVFLDSFGETVRVLYGNLLQLVYFFVCAIPLCLSLGFGSWALLKKTKDRWKNQKLCRAAEIITLLFPLYTLLDRCFFHSTNYVFLASLHQLIFCLLCLAFLLVLVCIAAHLTDKRLAAALYLCVGAAVVSLAPMLVVSPIAERCVFHSYFFLAAAALLILEALMKEAPERVWSLAQPAVLILSAALSLCLVYNFANIQYVNGLRMDYIEDMLLQEPEEINLCMIPSEYVFYDGPHYFGTWFYNEQRHDINFTFSEFPSWQARRRMEGWLP